MKDSKRIEHLRGKSVEDAERKEQAKQDRDMGVKFEMFKILQGNSIATGENLKGKELAKATIETLKELGYE